MNRLFKGLSAVAICLMATNGAFAEDEHHNAAEPTHFPIHKPKEQSWSFAGPFGSYNKEQLQRGLKIYVDVCSSCHSLERIAFRNLTELGYSDEQIKGLIVDKGYEIDDALDENGETFTRPASLSDYFPKPFANDLAAAASNGGAVPPDLSLMAKARAPERGFPTFIFDIFTNYAENGPDYIYSLLTGYGEEPPAGMQISEGTYYNPYFISAKALAMAQPISDGDVEYTDGSPETVDQYAKDISAFLMWTAEPTMTERKKIGFRVLSFLLLFGGLLYLTKRKVWSKVSH